MNLSIYLNFSALTMKLKSFPLTIASLQLMPWIPPLLPTQEFLSSNFCL